LTVGGWLFWRVLWGFGGGWTQW